MKEVGKVEDDLVFVLVSLVPNLDQIAEQQSVDDFKRRLLCSLSLLIQVREFNCSVFVENSKRSIARTQSFLTLPIPTRWLPAVCC